MKHFWLDADQQALMDSATSTAGDYTHIAVLKLGKSWKRELKGQTGFKVEPADYLRTYKVCRVSGLDYDSLVRLTASQAMTMKLRYAGTDDGHVHPDPTGEFWGNMLIAQHDNKTHNYMSGFWRKSYDALFTFAHGKGFGPTLGLVGSHCKGLPVSWGRSLVWNQAHLWHFAEKLMTVPGYVPEAHRDAYEELFEEARTPLGKLWASDFYQKMQEPSNRYIRGLRDDPNEDIL